MFKKILLATTPQIDTQTAPKAAFDMVRKYDAELLIYHALPIGKDDWCSFDDTIPAQKLVEASAAKIREFYAEDLKTIPNHSIRVITGASHDKLFKLVHTEGVDLIVMGHHTSASIYPGSMLGSVNTAIRDVCSNAFCPTMVVTHEGSKSANIKKIVFATDFSTPSDSALCYTTQLARQLGAHIDVFHVLDTGQRCPNPEFYMQDMNVFVDKAKAKMQQRYAKPLEGLSHSFECWEGVPYVEILKKARWSEADLVVMAQYSSSLEGGTPFIGSTVIQVALSPGCPALIVNYRARTCS